MVGSHQHWGYSEDFYNNRLAPEQRKLFHGFLFDPAGGTLGLIQSSNRE